MADQGKSGNIADLELLKHDDTANAPELLKHDKSANAPERDTLAEAPKVNHSASAPQGLFPSALEVAYSDAPPLTLDEQTDKEAFIRIDGTDSHTPRFKISRRVRITLLAGIGIIAIAIATGAGIGVATKHATSAASTASALPSSPRPASGLMHGVINDSSFAAVSAFDNTRYVFFQDTNGSLRQALYSQLTQSWTTNVTLTVPNTANARNNTPLSAIIQTGFDGGDEVFLVYISTSNNLAARWFVSGQWATPQETEFVNLVGFVASLDSRSLSVNLLPNSNNSQLCLVFEGPDNNITALYGSKNLDPALNTGEYGVEDDIPLFTVSGPTPSSGNPFWTWNKIAITLRNNEMWTSNAKIGSPFAITSFNQTLVATFFSQIYANTSDVFLLGVGELSSNSSNSSFLLDGFYYYGSPAFGGYPLYASSSFSGQFPIQNSSIPQSDVILGNISGVGNIFGPNTFGPSGYWVNDSTLTSFAGFGKSQARFSASPFPYTRLASTSPWNSEAFYMYHQINASMLAEDVWDVGQAAWTSSNISIATS